MNPLPSSAAEFAALVQHFFTERLQQQRNASPQTIVSYRDTFRLFLRYAERQLGRTPALMTLNDCGAPLVLDFLDHLEAERRNSIRSRNARLAAIRAFAHYAVVQCPHALPWGQQILAIPMKQFEKPLLGFLSREEVQAILAASDARTWWGRRDRLLIAVLYNTGARVSELIGIRVSDLVLEGTASVRLRGKGRKQRTVPLWRETVVAIRHWLCDAGLQPDQPLVPNRHCQPMTRANVVQRIHSAVRLAIPRCPSLAGRSITPHTLRHTTAMHLLQAGIDITVIALWLGHESPVTTHGYIEADLAMKERALATLHPLTVKNTRYRPTDSLIRFLETL